MKNIIQSVYDKIRLTGNFHSIDKLDIEQRFDFMEFAKKKFEDYKLHCFEMANSGMISIEDYLKIEQQHQYKQIENIAKVAAIKYSELLDIQNHKNEKPIEVENIDLDIETKNNFNKILDCNYHLLNSLDKIKLYNVLQYSKKIATDISFNHKIKDYSQTPENSLKTNLEYQIAKEAHDKIEKRYNEVIENFTNEQPEPIDNYKYSVKQRFYLLVKTGILETEMFKGNGISQNAKHHLLAKILSCDVRTAKGMFNNETTYQMSIDNQNDIEKMYNKITNNKDL